MKKLEFKGGWGTAFVPVVIFLIFCVYYFVLNQAFEMYALVMGAFVALLVGALLTKTKEDYTNFWDAVSEGGKEAIPVVVLLFEIGMFSASHIPDGDVKMSIKGGPAATIRCRNHHLVTIKQCPDDPRSVMEFGSMKLANDLFNGKVSAMAQIGEGTIAMHGMINMIDNINRILDRVGLYLA